MNQDNFCDNINDLFKARSSDVRMEEDKVYGGIILDDDTQIFTFPIIDHEERFLSEDTSVSYTYLSIKSYGRLSETVRIKSDMLFQSNTFLSCFGAKPFAYFGKNGWNMFFFVIETILHEVEQIEIYTYSGWSKDLSSFILGTLRIDMNNITDIYSSLVKNKVVLSECSANETLSKVSDIISNISANMFIGYVMLMYQLLSFLKQRLISACNICPQFVLGIDGRTGSYKTSVTSALFNPIGVTSCSFEDTLASIRRTFQSNQSGITIIDDYKRQTKTNDEKYENITRLSGDIGTTGKRVSGDKVCGDVVTGMSVITGELRPCLQQSSYSRILFVDLNNSPINREYLTLLQNSKPEYTSFLALFIQDIMRCDDFDKSFVECFKEHRNSLIKEEHYQGMHGRYYEMYAWLAAMWDYYVEFLNKSNLQSKVDFDFKNELKAYIYNQHCFYNDDPLILFKKG